MQVCTVATDDFYHLGQYKKVCLDLAQIRIPHWYPRTIKIKSSGFVSNRQKQCSGSVTIWYGSRFSDPYHWLTGLRMPTKSKFFLPSLFCLLLIQGIFTSVLKNKLIRSHKAVEIKVFPSFMLIDGKIWNWSRNRVTQKLTDLQNTGQNY